MDQPEPRLLKHSCHELGRMHEGAERPFPHSPHQVLDRDAGLHEPARSRVGQCHARAERRAAPSRRAWYSG